MIEKAGMMFCKHVSDAHTCSAIDMNMRGRKCSTLFFLGQDVTDVFVSSSEVKQTCAHMPLTGDHMENGEDLQAFTNAQTPNSCMVGGYKRANPVITIRAILPPPPPTTSLNICHWIVMTFSSHHQCQARKQLALKNHIVRSQQLNCHLVLWGDRGIAYTMQNRKPTSSHSSGSIPLQFDRGAEWCFCVSPRKQLEDTKGTGCHLSCV